MINAIEYVTEREGVLYALKADKDVTQKNAWHLASVSGNGTPPASTMGEASHGVDGRSYHGLNVDGREIGAVLYADGHDAAGCQRLLSEASFLVSTDDDALGYLRLTNAAGVAFRIPAKCVDLTPSNYYRRSAKVSAVFDCPFPYFESDVLHSTPLFAVEGGKEYPIGVGLERPYTFGSILTGGSDQTVVCFNEGDAFAPCTLKLFGAGLERVEITNQTTGATIIVEGMSVGGVEICTDENNLFAVFDDGSDASAYVSQFSNIADFKLKSGANVINVKMDASSVTAAGTVIEWRGRFTSCL